VIAAANGAERTGRALWHARVDATPDRSFLFCEGRSWSFGELDLELRRLAAGLAANGVRRGDPVLVGMGNRYEALLAELAIAELGAVFVPLLPGLGFDELAFPVNHSEAKLLIADGESAGPLLPRIDELPGLERLVLTHDVEHAEHVAGRAELLSFADLAAADPLERAPLPGHDEDALAAVLYTSGSTGRPKGVMLRAGCFHSVGEAFALRFGIGADDVCLLPTSLAHAVGSLTSVSIATHQGSSMHVVDRFSPSRFWQDVATHDATFSILFPAHLNLLMETERDAPAVAEHSYRLVITHAHDARFAARFGVDLATVWGMTETGALCVGSEPGYGGELGANYVGTPMEGVEIGVFDDELKPVPRGERGEIALRHRHVMLGYLKDPEATAQTLVAGWVRSGDQGTLDEAGRLFFVGRIKNVIKRSGENVSAEEVEEALAAQPGVAECTVFGVPDRLRTEEVAAVVVRSAGAVGVDPAGLRAGCGERLVRWKLPRFIALTDEPLPRLANGKLDRVALRRAFDLDAAWDAERDSSGA
jgi:crotonobetaine/carnitine-CoA ligase